MRFSHAQSALIAIIRGTLQGLLGGGWRECVFCSHKVPAFLPWRGGYKLAPPIIHALHMIGSDLDHFACPYCGSTDRERHLYQYFLRTDLPNWLQGKRILHFAPEKQLSMWIATFEPFEYVRGDLFPGNPSIQQINMESIPFNDGYFDCVIANHVLEHVENLFCATREIARVLNTDGIAILQTPWCTGLSKTIEDQSVTDPYSRLHLFGQEDHLRIFGRDIYELLSSKYLVASPVTHNVILPDIDENRYGVNRNEEFMVFYKK